MTFIHDPFPSISFSIISNTTSGLTTIPRDLLPPLTDVWYKTFDEIVAAVNKYIEEHGYAVFKKRIKATNARGIYKVVFNYTRDKIRTSESYRKRVSLTTKYNCLFSAYSTITELD